MAESGIDAAVGLLRGAGVDMFNVSGWYQTIQRTEGLRHVRAQAPGAATYFELTHSTANHPYFVTNTSYGTTGWPRTADNQLYSTARLALLAGAHGISLFNFVYYRHIQGNDLAEGVACEPPFHVMRHLADEPWLARHPGHYHLGGHSYFSQLPRNLQSVKPEAFRLELAPHANAIGARLRVHLRSAPPSDRALRALPQQRARSSIQLRRPIACSAIPSTTSSVRMRTASPSPCRLGSCALAPTRSSSPGAARSGSRWCSSTSASRPRPRRSRDARR